MKIHLASTAELYAEHRRTGSTRKRERIAAELQRRHDETYGGSYWGFINGPAGYESMWRFNFALQLPPPTSHVTLHRLHS